MNVFPLSDIDWPSISAVLVSWNRCELMQQAIQSLRNQQYSQLEFIIVDNGSTDGSLSWLRTQADLVLVENQRNRGASVARNQGTRLAKGKYVLYMDSDAEIHTREGLKTLIAYMEENEQVAGISGVIYSDASMSRIWSWSTCMDWEANHDLASSLVPNQYPQALSTCFVIFRASALREAGGFDEYYFYLYEDADLCDRLKKRGYRLHVLPEVKIIHHYAEPGRTRRGNIEYHYYHEKLRMYFLLKNWGVRRFLLSWWSKVRTPLAYRKRFPYLSVLSFADIYFVRVFLLLLRYPLIRWKRRWRWI
ncbi:MAG: glycosyltransferase family 2 protein [Candidatus Omnitrophota bacterium]|jgi:GT2 family glycosyltransferase|nr:MAG: glycosyltransferase family 2 protein [Candidatus Omnitrophota bacterium]